MTPPASRATTQAVARRRTWRVQLARAWLSGTPLPILAMQSKMSVATAEAEIRRVVRIK